MSCSVLAGCNLWSRHDRPTAFTSQLPLSWGQGSSFLALETLGLFGLNLIGSLPAEWGCPRCFINLQVLSTPPPPTLTSRLPLPTKGHDTVSVATMLAPGAGTSFYAQIYCIAMTCKLHASALGVCIVDEACPMTRTTAD